MNLPFCYILARFEGRARFVVTDVVVVEAVLERRPDHVQGACVSAVHEEAVDWFRVWWKGWEKDSVDKKRL